MTPRSSHSRSKRYENIPYPYPPGTGPDRPKPGDQADSGMQGYQIGTGYPAKYTSLPTVLPPLDYALAVAKESYHKTYDEAISLGKTEYAADALGRKAAIDALGVEIYHTYWGKAPPVTGMPMIASPIPKTKIQSTAPIESKNTNQSANLPAMGKPNKSEPYRPNNPPRDYGKSVGGMKNANGGKRVGGGGVRRPGANRLGSGGSNIVTAPVSFGTVSSVAGASFTSGKGGSILVRHREYLRDVTTTASTDYQATIISLNPALQSTFPWLCSIARNYEEYKLRSFVLDFEPACSTSTAGQTMLACDHDAADSSPETKVELLQLAEAQSAPVWAPQKLRWKCDGVTRFTRTGALAANLDIKTYDAGNIHLAFNGVPAATYAGALFVTYCVLLSKPHFSMSDNDISNSMLITSGGTVAKATPFGTVPVLSGGLGVTVNTAGDTLTFVQPGRFLLNQGTIGTAIIDTAPTLTVANCTATNAAYGAFGMTHNTAGTLGDMNYLVVVPAANATLKVDYAASGTITGGVCRIARFRDS